MDACDKQELLSSLNYLPEVKEKDWVNFRLYGDEIKYIAELVQADIIESENNGETTVHPSRQGKY